MPLTDLFISAASGRRRQRVLVIGNEDLALAAHEGPAGLSNEYLMTMNSRGFRWRLRQLEAMGIRHPGLGLGGALSGIASVGYDLRKESGGDWHFPTWHLLLADTDEGWMHPGYWTRRCEDNGDVVRDDENLANLVAPGGVFAFRHIAEPEGDDAPPLWRRDWKAFLAPYFMVEEAEENGVRYLMAVRNGVLPERWPRSDYQPW